MSDRRRLCARRAISALAVAIFATPGAARAASAQLTSRTGIATAHDSTPQQRYAAAQAERKAVRELAGARDQARRALGGGAVIRAGIIALRYDSAAIGLPDRILLGAAVREAATVIGTLYGDDATATFGTLTLNASLIPTNGDTARRDLWIRTAQPVPGASDWRGPTVQSARDLPTYIANVAGQLAELTLTPAMRAWSPMPARPATSETWYEVASLMSKANSSVAQRCRAGAIVACAAVLDYDSTTTPLQTFYAPSDYPLLAARFSSSKRDSIADPMARRCILSDDAAACSDFAHRLTLDAPLPRSVRRSVISLALETGGPHAFSRLRAATGGVREQLAAAAGIPTDSLTRLWIKRVNESSRSSSGAPFFTLAWTALLLVAINRRPTCN